MYSETSYPSWDDVPSSEPVRNLEPPPYMQPPSYANTSGYLQQNDTMFASQNQSCLNSQIYSSRNASVNQEYAASDIYADRVSNRKEMDPFDTSHISNSNTDVYKSMSAHVVNYNLGIEQETFESLPNTNGGFENNFVENTYTTHIQKEETSESDILSNRLDSISLQNSSPSKLFDKKFIQELEKNLGKKEASANSNIDKNSAASFNSNVNEVNDVPILRPPPQSSKLSNKYAALESLKDTTMMRRPNPSDYQSTSLYDRRSVNVNESQQNSSAHRYSMNTSNVSNNYQADEKPINITANSDTNELINQMWKEQLQNSQLSSQNTPSTSFQNRRLNDYDTRSLSSYTTENNISGNKNLNNLNRSNSVMQNNSGIGEFKSNRTSTLPRMSLNATQFNQSIENVRQNSITNHYSSTVQPVYNELNDHYSIYGTSEVQSENVAYHLYSNDAPGFVSVTGPPRLYDEVFEGAYGTGMTAGVLRPHRPAPPCPMEIMQNTNAQVIYHEIPEM